MFTIRKRTRLQLIDFESQGRDGSILSPTDDCAAPAAAAPAAAAPAAAAPAAAAAPVAAPVAAAPVAAPHRRV